MQCPSADQQLCHSRREMRWQDEAAKLGSIGKLHYKQFILFEFIQCLVYVSIL